MKISFLMYEPVQDLAELDRRMERVAALGFQGIELVGTYPLGFEVEDLVALTRKHRLPVVSFLSGWSYSAEGLCLASPDGAVRERAAARLGDYAGYAARLGAVVVVGLMQGLRSDEPDEAKANDRIADCFGKAARAAEKLGTTLVMEPVNHLQVGFNHTAAEAAALVKRVGSPALSYMLDTIHMHMEERSVAETIRVHGPQARHFHLCESNGGPYGTGNLDFDMVLGELRQAGYRHWVSTKIYRKVQAWEEAARSAADFLARHGEVFDKSLSRP